MLGRLWKSVRWVLAGTVLAYASPSFAQEESLWSAAQKAGVLRCGTAQAVPYIMKDPVTGNYTGYFVELCREFADVLKV